MNKNAQAWVAALRSGEYKQGRTCLAPTLDTYCCLGVACELAVKAGACTSMNARDTCGKVYYSIRSSDKSTAHYVNPEHYTNLPKSVIDWLGIRVLKNDFDFSPEEELTALNDTERKTFAEIADIIEKRQGYYFVE